MRPDGIFPRQIKVRVEDEHAVDAFAYVTAFLIHSNIAFLRFGDFIELYQVRQIEDEVDYEVVAMLAPFEIGKRQEPDFDQMVADAVALSFGEFWNRHIEVFCSAKHEGLKAIRSERCRSF